MPWKKMRPMDSKIQFISFALDGNLTMTELCSIFNISRKTGYKWIHRYLDHGPEGLIDQSKAPKSIPHKTVQEITDFIVSYRTKHPTWGARKIIQKAQQVARHLEMPSEATVHNIIKRQGLTNKKRKRRKLGHPGRPTATAKSPNDIWTTDFKGQFKTKDGQYCYPLTILDEYSRFLIDCQGLRSTGYKGSFKVFKRIFKEYGLPSAIKSDNGIPFASTGIARLSKLSVWWIKLGINPILIQPASPYQNGVHERMHKTLKYESTVPPSGDLKAQQRRFNNWKKEYNFDRPHESLKGNYPSMIYKPSLRTYPSKTPKVEYPAHFEVRFVSANHCFRWNHNAVPISSTLVHEYVGLEEVMDGIWAVYFSWKRLGFLDVRKMRIKDDLGRLKRCKV
jgi:putative transposase